MAFELVVVGTSLGGSNALEVLLSGLPKSFPLSISIVQHRHKNANILSAFLQRHSALPLKEAEDKEVIVPGWVYLAPADYHLLVEPGKFALSTDAPVLYARPSIDVLFESAAEAYAERVIGVILTGASQDGTQGMAKIKACGGLTVVQEPETAECYIMPKATIAAVTVDWILPLANIASLLLKVCQGSST